MKSVVSLRRCVLCLALLGVSAGAGGAEGEPDPSFGQQGFVRYERSAIPEEPHIERGLGLALRNDGRVLALAQHRYFDALESNHPLLVVFDGQGALLHDSLFAAIEASEAALLTATLDRDQRTLLMSDSGGGAMLDFRVLQPIPGGGFGYVAAIDAQLASTQGQGDAVHAAAGLSGGDVIVCGSHRAPFAGGDAVMPLCRRFGAGATLVPFGNGSPFIAPASFYVNEFDIAGLQEGRILAAREDAAGRILLSGMVRLAPTVADLLFSARLLSDGSFDPSYCAAQACDDATASASGWRADTLDDVGAIQESALIERPDGRIAHVLDVRLQSTLRLAAAVAIFDADGRREFQASLLLGEWTRAGAQPAVQPDNRLVLALSYRPDASTQLGALLRVPADPAVDGLFDTGLNYAPAGTTPLAGVSVLQPTLPGGAAATSVECNAVLLESGRATCAGLVRVGDAPVNLDLLLARIELETGVPLFRDGMEP